MKRERNDISVDCLYCSRIRRTDSLAAMSLCLTHTTRCSDDWTWTHYERQYISQHECTLSICSLPAFTLMLRHPSPSLYSHSLLPCGVAILPFSDTIVPHLSTRPSSSFPVVFISVSEGSSVRGICRPHELRVSCFPRSNC